MDDLHFFPFFISGGSHRWSIAFRVYSLISSIKVKRLLKFLNDWASPLICPIGSTAQLKTRQSLSFDFLLYRTSLSYRLNLWLDASNVQMYTSPLSVTTKHWMISTSLPLCMWDTFRTNTDQSPAHNSNNPWSHYLCILYSQHYRHFKNRQVLDRLFSIRLQKISLGKYKNRWD